MPGKKVVKRAAQSKEERSDRMVEKKLEKQKEAEAPLAPAGTSIKVKFSNAAAGDALLYLVDRSGIERFMFKLEPGKNTEQSCLSPATWKIKVGGKELEVVANRPAATYEIAADRVKPA